MRTAGPLINYAIDCEHSEPRAPALPGWSRAEPFIGVLWVALSCTARFRRRLGLNASRRPHLLAPISGQTSSNQAILSSSRQRALVDYQHTVSREVRFNDRVHAFAGYWHFHPRACAPYRARTKGKDERGVGYVKRNAIAGHDFVNWPASEGDLDWWMREIAQRVHGTTGEVPLIRFQRDEAAALAALDGPAAVSPETRAGAAGAGRLRVAVDGNSYSIPWRLIGESVQVTVCGVQVCVSLPARKWPCTPRPPAAASASSTRPTFTGWPGLGRSAAWLRQRVYRRNPRCCDHWLNMNGQAAEASHEPR